MGRLQLQSLTLIRNRVAFMVPEARQFQTMNMAGGQTMSDEGPGGQTPAEQLVKKQERETDEGKAPSARRFFETWDEHLKKHGKNHRCGRCVWKRNRRTWEWLLVYRTKSGHMEPWIEEICDPQPPWGLGCKLCRLAGMDNAYARGDIRATSSRCRRTATHRQAGWMQLLVVTQVPRSTVPTTPQSRDTVAGQAEQGYRREPP